MAGGPYTGAALNPARVFGPALVFDCFWNTAFVYIVAQLLGGFAAAGLVLPLYGFGQFGSLFDTRIFGWLGIRVPHRFSQVCFCIHPKSHTGTVMARQPKDNDSCPCHPQWAAVLSSTYITLVMDFRSAVAM